MPKNQLELIKEVVEHEVHINQWTEVFTEDEILVQEETDTETREFIAMFVDSTLQ